MKDHEIREAINKLRDIAKEWHAYEQLRDRICHVILDMVEKLRAENTEPLKAVQTLLREWTTLSTEWSEVTITVKKNKEGKIVGFGKTAKVAQINPEWLGYPQDYYVELNPVKPVITRGENGGVNYDYTGREGT